MKRLILMGFLVLLLAVLLFLSPATVTSFLYDFSYFETPVASDIAFCRRVVDGDTIVIDINKGDEAILYDAERNVVDVYGY